MKIDASNRVSSVPSTANHITMLNERKQYPSLSCPYVESLPGGECWVCRNLDAAARWPPED